MQTKHLQHWLAEHIRYTSENMLTQNTWYLRHVSFYSLSTNLNSPSRRINVESFSLDRTADGRLVLHAWAIFIQVMISTKRSDTIAIALVRIGPVPSDSRQCVSVTDKTRHGKPTTVDHRHRVSDLSRSGERCCTTHKAACGVADGQRATMHTPSSMKKTRG